MNIELTQSQLTVMLSLGEKVFSLHGNFHIPRSNIASITEGKPKGSWADLKIPGTFFPGLIKAGTFYSRRGKEFWYVTRSHKHIYTIELTNMSYKRLVLGTIKKIL